MQVYLNLLRHNRNYARLWGASAVSLLGDWFNTIVLLALVAQVTEGSGLAVSGFLLARAVPPVIVSPIAGVLADRFNRKHLMIVADLLRASVVLSFLLVIHNPERLWLVYCLTVAQFSLTALFDPARAAIVPNLIPQKQLVQATTLDSITWSFMLAAGGIIGGAVAALIGITGALLIDAGTFIVSALLVSSIRLETQNTDRVQHKKAPSQTHMLVDGLRYAIQHPAQTVNILVKAGGHIGSTEAISTIFATQLFVMGEGGATSLGILCGASGLGAIMGPLLLNRFNDNRVKTMQRLITLGFVSIVLGWLLMGSAANLWLVAAALCLRAMGASANWTYSSVIIQKTIPDAYLGRMFALDMIAYQLMATLSTALTGVLIDLVGPADIRLLALGFGIAALLPLGLWQLAMRHPSLRDTSQPIPGVAGTD